MSEERQTNEGTQNEESKTTEVHTEKTTTTKQGDGEPQTTHTEKTESSGPQGTETHG